MRRRWVSVDIIAYYTRARGFEQHSILCTIYSSLLDLATGCVIIEPSTGVVIMVIGYVLMIVTCSFNGQYCNGEIYKQDGNAIYATEQECLARADYYNEYFHPAGDLGCGEVQR
ncbi:hypothetical protein TROPICALSUN_9 [Erwinia phage vB_EamM_TropicalSun]|uniref:Uncharacterized protein n=1 Tax=Erwinia phage vB_EamM_TropicalSun TaxID=2591372 RepID=A0A5B9NNQ4_9CAUD|nr:hypothetical protein TROPICALSUN_9 [Erwinia phage vB_EamM_TropicalSun]